MYYRALEHATTRVHPYATARFAAAQAKIDALGPKAVASALAREQGDFIRALSSRAGALSPRSVARDILIPRRDLYLFLVCNWITRLLVPSLDKEAREGLLIFGIGRLFSSYNDTGAQSCTDVDLNFVVGDGVSSAARARLWRAIEDMQGEFHASFGIHIELNPDFTLRTPSEIAAALASGDAATRRAAELFYKCNAKSLMILHGDEASRQALFKGVEGLGDHLFFDSLLGRHPKKATWLKLRNGGSCIEGEEGLGGSVIGSKAFERTARRLAAIHPDLFPQRWSFSMKHFANRVYDYASALRHQGYSLEAIGFEGEADPDYRFVCDTHILMLYLQELAYVRAGSFDSASDGSYMTSRRFSSIIGAGGAGFLRDLDDMAVKGRLLLQSRAKKYLYIRKGVAERLRDRVFDLSAVRAADYLEGAPFGYEIMHRDSSAVKVCVPYAWEDVGYCLFSAIAERMNRVIEGKLIPALPGLGLPARELKEILVH